MELKRKIRSCFARPVSTAARTCKIPSLNEIRIDNTLFQRTEPSTTSTTDREIGHFRRAAEIDNIKKNPPGPKKWKSSIR